MPVNRVMKLIEPQLLLLLCAGACITCIVMAGLGDANGQAILPLLTRIEPFGLHCQLDAFGITGSARSRHGGHRVRDW